MYRYLLGLLLLVSSTASGNGLQVGQAPPDLTIADRGELLLEDDKFSYQPWQLPHALGKVHVLQYMAARSASRDKTKPFTDRLQKEFHFGSYHVTTVINLDDALWGTSVFVVGEVKSSKRKYPASTIVLDEEGTGLETWQLQSKNAAIIVMDPGGSVLYLKEGAMSDEEIDSTVELIRQNLTEQDS